MAEALARSGEQAGLQLAGTVPGPCHVFADHEHGIPFYAPATHHSPGTPAFSADFGEAPVNVLEQAPGQRLSHLNQNYIQTPDVIANVNINDQDKLHTGLLGTELPNPQSNEPLTPPGLGTNLCPSNGTLVGNSTNKQYESIADVMGLYRDPLDPFQGQSPAPGYDGGDQMHHVPEYTLGSVAGIYEAQPGFQQPPVFFDPADPEALDQSMLFGIFDNTQR